MLKGGNVNLQIGSENVVLVYNDSGTTLNDGDLVYISGSQGNRPSVKLASASNESTQNVLGMVTETIPAGNEGFVTYY